MDPTSSWPALLLASFLKRLRRFLYRYLWEKAREYETVKPCHVHICTAWKRRRRRCKPWDMPMQCSGECREYSTMSSIGGSHYGGNAIPEVQALFSHIPPLQLLINQKKHQKTENSTASLIYVNNLNVVFWVFLLHVYSFKHLYPKKNTKQNKTGAAWI